MAYGLNCSEACGIFLDQNCTCLLHRQVDSYPLYHHGSPIATSWGHVPFRGRVYIKKKKKKKLYPSKSNFSDLCVCMWVWLWMWVWAWVCVCVCVCVLVRRVKEEKAEHKLLEQSHFKTTCYWVERQVNRRNEPFSWSVSVAWVGAQHRICIYHLCLLLVVPCIPPLTESVPLGISCWRWSKQSLVIISETN